jgi:hypothetical protein
LSEKAGLVNIKVKDNISATENAGDSESLNESLISMIKDKH